MSSAGTVEEIVTDAAQSIESDISDVDGFEEWVESHGLGRTDSSEAIVARQAAFHVALAATLYKSYRSKEGLSELDATSFHDAVGEAEEVTGDESFSTYFLADAAQLFGEDDLERLIEAGERFASEDDPAEAIGHVHESLVPRKDRHKLGQFRTPPVIADLMAEWVVRDADDIVLDPGIGAAALSTSAYEVKKSRSGENTLGEMSGVDLSPLSVLMADVSLRLSNGGGRPNLQTRNFLDLQPEDVGEVDAVISNPPYTRHHEFDEDVKAEMNSQMEDVAGRSISTLSPLYAYFYIHATQFLTDDGRSTFITPSEFLETKYGEDLKAFLLDNYHIRGFVLYDREADSQFDEALTTSFISFLERKTEDEEDDEELTKFVRVDDWPGQDVVLDAIEDGTEGETEWGFVNTVRQSALEPDDKWDDLLDPLDIGEDEQLVPFSEIGEVNRGIATGKNDYFCLSEEELSSSSGGYEWDIEDRWLSPLIRNARAVPHFDYREEDWEQQRDEGREVWIPYHLDDLEWVPEIHPDGTEEEDGQNTRISDFSTGGGGGGERPGVVEYLKYGMEELEVHEGYLASNREPWYVFDRRDPAPILYTYMSRSRGRFVQNKTGARNLTNLHCVYLDVELDETETKALLAYLNSPFADEIVKRHGRTYSTGMDKVEPNELEGVPVIDPRELDREVVEELAELFDDLCEASRNGDEDEVLGELSDALDDVLDV
ncbi:MULTISPECIES: class I SAM-dependent DNA methyltransferase [Halorussus]|uniref:HsdM family class I SAM-dependent methyltransferase n=1 Tax=Halorussus TaxID=1070314 RepID=UPI000E218BAF|nr:MULTISPECIES: N-6 DNA methylase [Halorussus]NHN60458.1 SAM-dependent DNA methyltransferase [Halorussus sp. JP-T4]